MNSKKRRYKESEERSKTVGVIMSPNFQEKINFYGEKYGFGEFSFSYKIRKFCEYGILYLEKDSTEKKQVTEGIEHIDDRDTKESPTKKIEEVIKKMEETLKIAKN